MKKPAALLSYLLFSAFAFAGDPNTAASTYRFSIDLTRVTDDKLMVTLLTPAIDKAEAVYRIPRIVPGTYEIYNFGRFVSDFKAYDKDGQEMPAEKLDDNSWKIKDARRLNKLTYWVEDTWDTEKKESFVFEPAGSNIEDGKNFVINTHAFFGYFDDMKRLPFHIEVTRPEKFYGSTGLSDVKYQGNVDTYRIADYMQLADAPIMYAIPDTTMLNIGGADILISVYSPNKTVSSKFIAKEIGDVLRAQKQYLGGQLPIRKYAFIIYLTDKIGGSGASGALEHSYSSMYFLPEVEPEALAQTMKDVAAHEFFHIITPLNIHAEQIGNFDYNTPSMSEHLWMYEGCTEYFASNVQVKHGLITGEQYLDVIREKMNGSDRYLDTLSFTRMSLGCLDKYRSQYSNVYEKGALIGMCLDIKLLHLSDGKYRLEDLMADLSKIYGKERAFKDEELFGQIVKLTYPEIGQFLDRYVRRGGEPLPIKETLALAGISYKDKEVNRVLNLGGAALGFNPETKRFVIYDITDVNAFGRKMGYKAGDELLTFNKKAVTAETLRPILEEFISNVREGDKIRMTVSRKTTGDKEKTVKLKAKIFAVDEETKHVLTVDPNPTDKQLVVRKAWMMADQ